MRACVQPTRRSSAASPTTASSPTYAPSPTPTSLPPPPPSRARRLCLDRSDRLLETSVLVLNRHYQPVHVTSVRRAFVLLYMGAARVVDEQYRTFDFDSWAALGEATVHNGHRHDVV